MYSHYAEFSRINDDPKLEIACNWKGSLEKL